MKTLLFTLLMALSLVGCVSQAEEDAEMKKHMEFVAVMEKFSNDRASCLKAGTFEKMDKCMESKGYKVQQRTTTVK